MAPTYDISALRQQYLGGGTTQPSAGAPSSDGKTYDVEALRQQYLGSTASPEVSATKGEMEDTASAEKYKPTFASEEGEGFASKTLKLAGNVPSSAFGLAKGTLELMNPVKSVSNLWETAKAIPEIAENAKYTGGAFNTVKEIAIDTVKGLKEFVPESWRQGLTGDIKGAVRTTVNDPVGQIAPAFFAVKGAAKVADRTLPNTVSKKNMADYVENIKENTENRVPIPTQGTKYSEMVDTAVETVTKPVVDATKYVFKKTGDAIGNTAKYTTSQVTGLNPETIAQVTKTPEVFTKEGMSKVDRPSLGRVVQSELQKKINDVKETGKGYNPIRESETPVAVDRKFLESVMEEIAGVTTKKGKIETSGTARVRDQRDVRALQHLYDLWKPSFQKGKISATEFLNFRSDLAKLAKFEREIGKSADIEGATSQIRARLNQSYRPQLPGLDKLDEQFGPMLDELKTLRKGFVDKEGNLTDSAINKIANATGKGKDPVIARLEQIVPGITERIKILKAVEDIQHATGQKVGAYFRPLPLVGGFVAGGPVGAAITAILASPGNAVSIIRRYGLMKNSNAIKTIMHTLQRGGEKIKEIASPTTQVGAFGPRPTEAVR